MPQKLIEKRKTKTKSHLINSIAKEKKIRLEDARQVIQAFLDKITESLARGDRLEFRYFGIFDVVHRKQKVGRNPKKPDVPIIIPARKAIKFTVGKKAGGIPQRN